MDGTPHLIFMERGFLYGVKATAVREIVWLPELAPVEETPECVAGLFSLRGRIVPVIDPGILFGHRKRGYSLSDSVIVFESGERLAGIMASWVADMIDIAQGAIQSISAISAIPATQESGRPGPHHRHMHIIEGEAKAGDRLVMVLDIDRLMDAAFAHETEAIPEAITARPDAEGFCPEATEEEQRAFHTRAIDLDRAAIDTTAAGRTAVAVVALGQERLGIDLDIIREFSEISGLVPVPCCPSHILGNMNLRGNVITIVDIREPLGIAADAKAASKKAIVAEIAGLIIGVAIDDLFEVVYVGPAEIRPADFVVEYGERHIKGTIPYNGSTIAYIDLRKILSRNEMLIDEEV